MALTYNIKEDAFYQEGLEEGKEVGKKEGLEEGQKMLISAMVQDGTLTLEKIASLAKVSMDYVKQVARERQEKG
jgi:predicted transposase YdaD